MKYWVLLLTTVGLFAQVQEEMQVVLRQVRVHVVDEDGNPVKGLGKDAFLLKENKKFRELSTFSEVSFDQGRELLQWSGDEDSFSPLKRSMVILLDSSNMTRPAYEAALQSILDFAQEDMGPGDLVKLVQLEQNLKHFSEFTSNPDDLQTAVYQMEYKGFFRQWLGQLQARVYNAYEQFQDQAGKPSSNPANDADVLRGMVEEVLSAVDEKERAKMLHARTVRMAMELMGTALSQSPGSRAIWLITGGTYLQNGSGQLKSSDSEFEDLSALLNFYDVTVYSVLQSPIEAIGDTHAAAAVTNLNNPLGIESSLEQWADPLDRNRIRKLFLGGGSASNSFFENETQIETGPRRLSEMTGGSFQRAYTTKTVQEGFDQILNRAKHYYLLGYVTETPKKKANLSVELIDGPENARIIYGGKAMAPPDFAKWKDKDRQLAFEVALVYGDYKRNDLEADFSFSVYQEDADHFSLPVQVRLPERPLPKKGYEIGFAAFDENHLPFDVVQATANPKQSGTSYGFAHLLLVPKAPKFVKCYVRDLDSGDHSLIEMPVVLDNSQTIQISPIQLVQPAQIPIIPLHQPEKAKLAKKSKGPLTPVEKRYQKDPLLFGPEWVAQNAGATVPANFTHLDLQFCVAGLGNTISDYGVRFIIQGQDATRYSLGQIKQVTDSPYGQKFWAQIPLGDLPSGTYELTVQVFHQQNGEAATRSIPFTRDRPGS
ncbi:MAG: VWA domain-containing protein [Acidobacteria bacterium]|nr:VWA domain-containing protein [Acidobacteriota bacterium]